MNDTPTKKEQQLPVFSTRKLLLFTILDFSSGPYALRGAYGHYSHLFTEAPSDSV